MNTDGASDGKNVNNAGLFTRKRDFSIHFHAESSQMSSALMTNANQEVYMGGNWAGKGTEGLIQSLEALANDLRYIEQGVEPLLCSTSVVVEDFLLFQRAVPCLAGRMFNHPEIERGRPGVTSELFFIDEAKGIARTLNRWYRLGKPGAFSQ